MPNNRFTIRKICSALLVILAVWVASCWAADTGAGPAAPKDDKLMGHGDAADIAVAKVNGRVINMAQLMARMLDVTEKRYGRREITPILAQKIKDESLKRLITEELAYQQAARTVRVSDEDVGKVVEARIKAMGGQAAFTKYLQDKQLKNRAAFENNIRKIITVQRYIANNIDSKVKVSEPEVKSAYEQAQKKFFHTPENIQVTKIVFFADPAAPGALQRVAELRKKIISKLDNQPEKLQADASFIVQKNIHLNKKADKKLYAVAKTLGENEISGPVAVHGNIYLIQLTGYKPASDKSFEMVKGYLRKELFNRKRTLLLAKWRASLRKGAHIEIVDLTP